MSDKPSEARRPSDQHERDHRDKPPDRPPPRDDERSKLRKEDSDSPGAEKKERGTELRDRGFGSGGGGGGGGFSATKDIGPRAKMPDEKWKEEREAREKARRKEEGLANDAKLRAMARSGR